MIIVTGASRGLGNAIAKNLIKQGHEVFGIARNIKDLEFEAASCDVSIYEDIKNLARKIKSKKIKIHALINAAGIASMNLALTTPSPTSQKIINVNLLGTIYCCQLFAPLMLRNKKGNIVNFSTIAVSLGLKGESIYVASKAGVEGFTKSFAREMSDFNINVNCIAPGPIDTDLIKGVSNQQIQNIIDQQIIKKKFKESDICNLVDILLDTKTSSISGQVLNVGGV